MRAMQIFMYILCINAAISISNSIYLFGGTNYLSSDTSEDYDYEIQELGSFDNAEPTMTDYIIQQVMWVWECIFWLVKFCGAFVYIYPALVDTLMVPQVFAVGMQGLFVLTWIWAIIQLKSGRGWGYFW